MRGALLWTLVATIARAASFVGLPDVKLPRIGGGELALAQCPAEKCVTIYVAPWCPHCRAGTPGLLDLKRYLIGTGIPVRIVVGMDNLEACQRYAREFGPQTAIDPSSKFQVRGVPDFFITLRGGALIKETPGTAEGKTGAELAAFLGVAKPAAPGS